MAVFVLSPGLSYYAYLVNKDFDFYYCPVIYLCRGDLKFLFTRRMFLYEQRYGWLIAM